MKLKDDLENPNEQSGSQSGSRYHSSTDFLNAYNLLAHEEHIEDDMWLLRGLVSVYLLKCLKLTDFFPNPNPNR